MIDESRRIKTLSRRIKTLQEDTTTQKLQDDQRHFTHPTLFSNFYCLDQVGSEYCQRSCVEMALWANSSTNNDVINSQSNYCSANPQIGAAMERSKNKGGVVDDAIKTIHNQLAAQSSLTKSRRHYSANSADSDITANSTNPQLAAPSTQTPRRLNTDQSAYSANSANSTNLQLAAPPTQMNYRNATHRTALPNHRVTRCMQMKIIPPLMRMHLQTGATFENAIAECYTDILTSINPQYRSLTTISRTMTNINGKPKHTLTVVAPAEAEEDFLRMRRDGLKILNRTIFPSADEIWRFSPSQYPKTFSLRITNLPALCSDEEAKEIIALPEEFTQNEQTIDRKQVTTAMGPIYNGLAFMPVRVNNEEQERRLHDWSIDSYFNNTRSWMEIPIYAHVPRCHTCSHCQQEGKGNIIGHDELWCRSKKSTPAIPIQTIEQEFEEALQNVTAVHSPGEPAEGNNGTEDNNNTHTDGNTDANTDANTIAESSESEPEHQHTASNENEEWEKPKKSVCIKRPLPGGSENGGPNKKVNETQKRSSIEQQLAVSRSLMNI